MSRFLRQAVRESPPGAPDELRIVYGGEVLRVRSPDLAQVRRALNARLHHPNAGRAEARRALVEALWAARPEGVAWNARRFAEEIPDRDEFEQFARAWWPGLAPADVLGWLADTNRVRRAGRDWLSEDDAARLARSWRAAPADLTVADVALVDELRVILGEPPTRKRTRGRSLGIDQAGDDIRELSTVTDRYFSTPERPPRPDNYEGYAHILVDEAQDVSPMQWRMLGRRGQLASWTIVGDAAQSAWPDPAEAHRARLEALEGKRIRRFHLTTNYRNSAEIFEFAASVVRAAVPDADLPVAVRRTGVPPDHRVVRAARLPGAVARAVEQLLGQVEGTVGVITPAARAEEMVAFLAERTRDGRTPARVQVVDAMRAKGMEYDAAVVVAPDEIADESVAGLRVLYVALTRATHRLVTVATHAWLDRLGRP
jgi:hypothetical protein